MGNCIKALLSAVALAVLPTPGIAQQMTRSDLVGAWKRAAAPARNPLTGLTSSRTMLTFNADGKRTWAYVDGQWGVVGDTLKFLGSYKFTLQGNSLRLFSPTDTMPVMTFTRADSAAKSGLVGTWMGGRRFPDDIKYKCVFNADSTFSWEEVYPAKTATPSWQLLGDTIAEGGARMYLAKLQNNNQELVLQKLWPDTKSGHGYVTNPTGTDETLTYTRVKP